MVIKQVELQHVCGITSKLPDTGQVEVAFAGKSNVGKSSLINALMNRKSLARTSAQPGKTQTINFYNINEAMYLVDLPGYGYAKVPKSEVAKWGQMMEEYLTRREELRAIILLIDIRHEPGKNDIMMYDWLKHFGFDIIIAATKSDKLNRSQIPKQLAVIRKTLKLQPQDVLIPFSGEKKTGVEELWTEIEKFLPGGEKAAEFETEAEE